MMDITRRKFLHGMVALPITYKALTKITEITVEEPITCTLVDENGDTEFSRTLPAVDVLGGAMFEFKHINVTTVGCKFTNKRRGIVKVERFKTWYRIMPHDTMSIKLF